MKKYAIIGYFLFILCACRLAQADNGFQRDFTKTQMPASYQKIQIKKQPDIYPTSPAKLQIPQTAPSDNAPILTPPPAAAETPGIPTSDFTSPSLPDYYSYKTPKITVPDYEQKYQQIIKAMQEKAAKKKKKLAEAVLEEIDRYGIFINVGLIILIVIHVIIKEREKTEHRGEGPHDEHNIWHEDF